MLEFLIGAVVMVVVVSFLLGILIYLIGPAFENHSAVGRYKQRERDKAEIRHYQQKQAAKARKRRK